jgi:hypothetical protein
VTEVDDVPWTLERRAFHEAGHAVARCAAGLRFRMVTIEPTARSKRGGHVRLHGGIRIDNALPVFDRAAMARWRNKTLRDLGFILAGSAAEVIRYPELERPGSFYVNGDPDDAGADAAVAQRLAALIAYADSYPDAPGGHAIPAVIVAAGQAMIETLTRHWEVVIELAYALVERRTLTYDEAKVASFLRAAEAARLTAPRSLSEYCLSREGFE